MTKARAELATDQPAAALAPARSTRLARSGKLALGSLALLLIAISSGAALVQAQAKAALDSAKSSLSASFKQMNVPIDGKFNRFTAQIEFDPGKIELARASLEIDMSSFDLGKGLDDYNAEVRKKDWFDSAKFPKASFVVSSVKAVGGNRLEAAGKLTMKGKTGDVLATINWKDDGGQRWFEGQVPLKRNYYGIGDGEWRDTSVVADDVVVKFRIVTAKN